MTETTSDFQRAGVIGWPVAHSRSPMIHGYWLKQYGIAGSYDRYPVEADRIDAFLADLAGAGLVGANVTIPHKEAAFRAAAEVDPVAAALGAVNTLWLEDGKLCGANTDAYGFLANLDAEAPGWDEVPGPAVVLGAGGAARAIVWALKERGFAPVHVVNRTVSRAAELVAAFGSPLEAHGWDALGTLLGDAVLVVNTTSLGMAGNPPLEIDLSHLPDTALVTDIVYVPLETPLLAAAKARGLGTVDGLGMLLHQAVPGFERWFGVRPDVTPALRQLVVDDLEVAS
ncbi:MAG: shikimate dehydrogenase [Hyphomicrobiales bacterium]|nr:MAG: shikimate dehydrogenase [Hyphomicrobiales bacterium]